MDLMSFFLYHYSNNWHNPTPPRRELKVAINRLIYWVERNRGGKFLVFLKQTRYWTPWQWRALKPVTFGFEVQYAIKPLHHCVLRKKRYAYVQYNCLECLLVVGEGGGAEMKYSHNRILACEPQTHFRSSLLSLLKITFATMSEKTVSLT